MKKLLKIDSQLAPSQLALLSGKRQHGPVGHLVVAMAPVGRMPVSTRQQNMI